MVSEDEPAERDAPLEHEAPRSALVRSVLAAAEERDEEAARRDDVADERDRVADRAAFADATWSHYGQDSIARRHAALDRSRSAQDRRAAAEDRRLLTAGPPPGEGPPPVLRPGADRGQGPAPTV